jgi:hypothetical protein
MLFLSTRGLMARLLRRVVGLLALFIVPALVRAAVPADSTHWHRQFSVGLQPTRFWVAGLVQASGGKPVVFQGLFPTVGGQLSPRWRVELAGWGQHAATPEKTETAVNGDRYRSASSSAYSVIPMLVRFSLLPHIRHWQIEALAGLMAIHTQRDTQFSYTPAGEPLRPLSPSSTNEFNDSFLLLGVGITYGLSTHWSVRGEASTNWSLTGSLIRTAFGGTAFPWQPGFGMGLHYTFAFSAHQRQ